MSGTLRQLPHLNILLGVEELSMKCEHNTVLRMPGGLPRRSPVCLCSSHGRLLWVSDNLTRNQFVMMS